MEGYVIEARFLIAVHSEIIIETFIVHKSCLGEERRKVSKEENKRAREKLSIDTLADLNSLIDPNILK